MRIWEVGKEDVVLKLREVVVSVKNSPDSTRDSTETQKEVCTVGTREPTVD